MKKFTDMLSAKLVARMNAVSAKMDDESGDVVQTLFVVALAVLIGGALLSVFGGAIQACINGFANGGSCNLVGG